MRGRRRGWTPGAKDAGPGPLVRRPQRLALGGGPRRTSAPDPRRRAPLPGEALALRAPRRHGHQPPPGRPDAGGRPAPGVGAGSPLPTPDPRRPGRQGRRTYRKRRSSFRFGRPAPGRSHRPSAGLRGHLRGARDRQDHHCGEGPGPAPGPGPGASHRDGRPHRQGRRPPGRGGTPRQGGARRPEGSPPVHPGGGQYPAPPARPASGPDPTPPCRQSPAAGLPGGGRGVHDRSAPDGSAAGRPSGAEPD